MTPFIDLKHQIYMQIYYEKMSHYLKIFATILLK